MAHDLEILERSCDDFGHDLAIPNTIQGIILSTISSTIIEGSSERSFGRDLDNSREDLFTILKSIRNSKIDTFELEELNVDIWFFIFSVHRFLSRVSILYFFGNHFFDFEPILECQKQKPEQLTRRERTRKYTKKSVRICLPLKIPRISPKMGEFEPKMEDF